MVDEDKRRFLIHLGIVGGTGVLGLAIVNASTTPTENLLEGVQETEQVRGYRKVWATKRDEDGFFGIPYEEYFELATALGIWRCSRCGYIYDATDGLNQRFDELPPNWECTNPDCAGATKSDFVNIGIGFRTGGQPLINERACAYHFDLNLDDRYEDEDQGKFCPMPCEAICPVDAIEKGPLTTVISADEMPKQGPVVNFDECISCGRCHQICGYNCIEWVIQRYRGKKARQRGGEA